MIYSISIKLYLDASAVWALNIGLHLYIKVCLFPTVLRKPPRTPPLQIFYTSLQRPYTQHASESHLELFSCWFCIAPLHPLLFPFLPMAIYAVERAEGVKGCKKLLPCFHMALCPESSARTNKCREQTCRWTDTHCIPGQAPFLHPQHLRKHLFSKVKSLQLQLCLKGIVEQFFRDL